MPQLETLCASTQARILVQETFSASSLDIVLSSGALVQGTFVCEEITLTASNAVHIQLDTLSFSNMTASLTMNSTLQGAATSGEELTLNATFDSTVDL